MNILKTIYDNNLDDINLCDEEEYFFNNIDKLIDNNYRKDNSEFYEVYTLLRHHYVKEFGDYIYSLREFYYEIGLLYLKIEEEKYTCETIHEAMHFIDLRRTYLKSYIKDSSSFHDENKVNTKLLDFFKDQIKYKGYDCVFTDFYTFAYSDMCKEEHDQLGDTYLDYIFPGLVWDDDLYDGFCEKYLYSRAVDYDTRSKDFENYISEANKLYEDALKKLKEI